MVFSCGESEHPATVRFDGRYDSDANKFIFMFENVLTRGKEDEYMAMEFMCHLEGTAIDFYYEKIYGDGSVPDKPKCYQFVKIAFIYQFGTRQEAEDAIRYATSAALHNEDLAKSLPSMDAKLKMEGFNDAGNLGLLRQSVILIPDLTQFAIDRSE